VRSPLDRIEAYYDAVPRPSARVEEIGPFTLFIAYRGWPYYARPRLHGPRRFTAADIMRVRERQRDLGVPEAFEWVVDVTPDLLPVARESGLQVREYPLMILHWDRMTEPIRFPPDVTVRTLDADDPAVAAAAAVAAVSFAIGGVETGDEGSTERDARAASIPTTDVDLHRDRLGRGLTVTVVAEDPTGPVAVGSHQPMGDVTEIVGVATLPTIRRRGLGAAVTAALIADAGRRDVDIVFLSAGSEQIARIYARAGFTRIGTAGLAEAP
jgi:GNAT superfamily N-acetyltransferase